MLHPTILTIPKKLTGSEELVVLPRRQFDKLLADKGVNESQILRWAREARKLKQRGKLPLLRSLKAWR